MDVPLYMQFLSYDNVKLYFVLKSSSDTSG